MIGIDISKISYFEVHKHNDGIKGIAQTMAFDDSFIMLDWSGCHHIPFQRYWEYGEILGSHKMTYLGVKSATMQKVKRIVLPVDRTNKSTWNRTQITPISLMVIEI